MRYNTFMWLKARVKSCQRNWRDPSLLGPFPVLKIGGPLNNLPLTNPKIEGMGSLGSLGDYIPARRGCKTERYQFWWSEKKIQI